MRCLPSPALPEAPRPPAAKPLPPTAAQVRRAVALDLFIWLDSNDPVDGMAVQLHRRLLAVLGRQPSRPVRSAAAFARLRGTLLEAIDPAADTVLASARAAAAALAASPAAYAVRGPFGEHGETAWTALDFGDAFPGDPVGGLGLLQALRRLPVAAQRDVVHRLGAEHAARDARRSTLGDTVLHDGVPARRYASVPAATYLRDDGSTAAMAAAPRDTFAPRQTASRRANGAERHLAGTKHAPADAQALGHDVNRAFQCCGHPDVLAVRLSDSATDGDIARAAESFRTLGQRLRGLSDTVVSGPEGAPPSPVQPALDRYRSCSRALRVIASWLDALRLDHALVLCEFCYRHRGTKRRCAEHKAASQETPASRRGKALAPLFMERLCALGDDPAVREQLRTAPEPPPDADIQALLRQAAHVGVPPPLRQAAATLAWQLRAFRPVLHATQRDAVAALFVQLLQATSAVFALHHGPTAGAGSLPVREQAAELLSLRWFFALWCGPLPPAFRRFGLRSPGHDRAQAQAACEAAHATAAVAPTWLMQRAWIEAEAIGAADAASPDRARIAALHAQGQSYRAIGRTAGCSHETVRKVLQALCLVPRMCTDENRPPARAGSSRQERATTSDQPTAPDAKHCRSRDDRYCEPT